MSRPNPLPDTAVQRTVPARAHPAPATQGVRSAFDQARKPKPSRVYAAMPEPAAVKVHAARAKPGASRTGTRAETYQAYFHLMTKPGQSIDLPTRVAKGMAVWAKRTGLRVSLRKISDTHTGVWREA